VHAVVVNVTINDPEAAGRALHEQLVPGVSRAPGFVAGYWTIKDNTGLTMLLFGVSSSLGGYGRAVMAV
jgi:hypothetical protein